MAAPERLKQGRGSSPDLPAPWQNPWRLLWRDLGAVLASLGLHLREFWRRNGEGSLWRPVFWPQGGAPLFWPLLAVGLGVLIVLGGRPLLVGRRPPPTPPLARGGPLGPQAAGAPNSGAASSVLKSLVLPSLPDPSVPPASAPQPLKSEPPVAVPPERNPGATPDPLLQALAPDDPEGWIGTTRAEPGASRLDLLVIDRFGSLAEPQRLVLAQQWQRRAEALGYEDLRLLDGRGRLLARPALIGSGMILLESPAAPPEA